MSDQLRAFVGHSFTDDDRDVVREFCDFFNSLKEMNIGFTWEHAERAESADLADKVLRLIDDKNLFIGICTKKEIAIDPSSMEESILQRRRSTVENSACTPKTSDWIIQEIGLAIGRKMDLILLLERGVRKPGGLQGNIEYIEFNRESTAESFKKILQMINSLLPKAKALPLEQADNRAVPTEKATDQNPQRDDDLCPKEDWDTHAYCIGLYSAIMRGDKEKEKIITDAFHASQAGRDGQMWDAMAEYFRILQDKEGKLATLEAMAKKNSDDPNVQRYLALAYEKYGEYGKAATHFEDAAGKAKKESDALKWYGEAAVAYATNGQERETSNTIRKLKEIAPTVEQGSIMVFQALIEVAKITKNVDSLLGLSERLLDICPDDIDARFTLAYKYSELKQDDLALFHYLKIPPKLRNDAVWNNLGVGFDSCHLTSKSVTAYREAEKLNGTLAMSNLANKLIGAGFLEEAFLITNRAIAIRDYHVNVTESISKVKTIPAEEEKVLKDITDRAKILSGFYQDYGDAIICPGLSDHAGKWKGPLCALSVSIKNGRFIAVGEYTQPNLNSLAQQFMAIRYPGTEASRQDTRYQVTYEGEIWGRAAKCSVTRKEIGRPTSEPSRSKGLLALADGESPQTAALMIIADSMKEIRVYEKSSGEKPNFYTFERMES